ncbi:MAG: pyruvate kinase [Anaerolineales bacterium]|nr:pyruvate kinase [Anaerolineales bacterium]
MDRKVKIIATIGPSSESRDMLEKLMRAGINVARLNFSHGTQEEHAQRIANIRELTEKLNLPPIAILQDLQGPKIRVGDLGSPIELQPGQKIVLYSEEKRQPETDLVTVPVDFPELFDSARVGNQILLDDGLLVFRVLAIGEGALDARVDVGGELSSHKGINLPGVAVRIPGFTAKDQADLIFGLEQRVDMVAVSFVRSADDIVQVRQAIENQMAGDQCPLIIAKLEKPEALKNLEEILEVSDGVMVARGDLGVEMPPETVPTAQKIIIRSANKKGKLVITATQMLDSMIHNTLPTRAEASDVANAVFDGTDAVMLSGETASGEHPVLSVEMMCRITCEAEAHYPEWGHIDQVVWKGHDDAISMTRAARELAHDRDVDAIVVFTRSGRTAWLMSKARPRVPIIAFTPNLTTYRRMAIMWGVRSFMVPNAFNVEEMLENVENVLRETKLVSINRQVVILTGFPVGSMRPPNMAVLHTLGENAPG